MRNPPRMFLVAGLTPLVVGAALGRAQGKAVASTANYAANTPYAPEQSPDTWSRPTP